MVQHHVIAMSFIFSGEKTKQTQEQEAYNPYAKEKMKEYLEQLMGAGSTLSCEQLPLQSKRDLLCALSAAAYCGENGYTLELLDGYLDVQQMRLRRFRITKEEPV